MDAVKALSGQECQPALPSATAPGRTPAWKRAIDITVGSMALCLLAPIMIGAALLVGATSRGPVLFRQTRVGLNEQPFTMLKFRTMRRDAGELPSDREQIARELAGSATPDGANALYRPLRDPRVTRVGALLRRLSIDELPQLFNVLKGDMSLVGPRPALPWEVAMFTATQRRRHICAPGITGLWQVSGRNRLSSSEMLELDLQYARDCSLGLDLKILAATPAAVLLQRHTR
mgnify:CR=1 FL=1